MHLHINVHCKAPTRGCLRDVMMLTVTDIKDFSLMMWLLCVYYLKKLLRLFCSRCECFALLCELLSPIIHKDSNMAFGKKNTLPLSHSEKLRNHMNVFTETLDNLRSLELDIAEELNEVDEKRNVLNQDLNATREAIARVRQVTG